MKALVFLFTLVALLALAALPAAAKPPQIEATADPLAPAGQTPIVLFTASALQKGKQYRLLAGQRSGESPWRDGAQGKEEVCERTLGSLAFQRADKKGQLEWDPRPSFFFSTPELVPTYYDDYRPCAGSYEGALLEKARNGARTVRRFTLTVPGLKLKYVK